MPKKQFVRKIRPLEFLNEEGIASIHEATMDVLERTGVRIESEWGLGFLAKNGCRVDDAAMRVRFPRTLVEECLRQAPSSFTLLGRTANDDVILGGDYIAFSHSAGMQTVDLRTFEPRQPTKNDYIDCIRVLDALPALDHLGCYPYFGFDDISPLMAIPEGVALGIRFSTKHQAAACSNDCEIFTIQLAQAVGGELLGTLTSSSPLTWGENAIVGARRMVEAGFAVTTVDGCVLGGTGPATVPGSVVVSNAEHFAMIVLVQLLNPGHRMCIGHFALPMNMATGSPDFGQVTSSLSNVAFNQMWRHYGLPVGNGSPGYTSSKTIDFQAGYEKSMAALAAAVSGANHILLHFGVSAELTAHPVQAVLDDDIAGMVGRFVEGEEVTPETVACELINEVGPIPGHYLSKAHTRKWWRKEQYIPQVADRLTYSEWLEKGKKSALDYAIERTGKILETHHAEPLAPSQEADLDRILSEAREYYRLRSAA